MRGKRVMTVALLSCLIAGCDRKTQESNAPSASTTSAAANAAPSTQAADRAAAEADVAKLHKALVEFTQTLGSLTDDQKSKIAGIEAETTAAIRGNPSLAKDNHEALEKAVHDEILKILTPAQRALIEKPPTGVSARLPSRSAEAKSKAAQIELSALKGALNQFELENGRFPTTQEGLAALVTNPGGLPSWHQDLDQQPLDPWGHPFVYKMPGTGGKEYDLSSLGPDGVPSDDDITN
jgi:type II secretion system protein G